jgi:hypothetical protein
MSERAQTAGRLPASAATRRLRLVVILGAAIAAGLIAWLVLKGDDNGTGASGRAPASAASQSQLQALPGKTGHDVFWAGAKTGYTYELTQTSKGNIYIRYLPSGVAVGDPKPNYLTVGTYPRAGAYGILKKVAKNPGSEVRQVGGGGIAVRSSTKPTSVFVAYPGEDLEIEVYDPSPSRALRLAVSGKVSPVG